MAVLIHGNVPSWKQQLLHQNIKAISVKDFYWEKTGGKWKVHDVPIGEGMIDFKSYFALLKKYNISVPVSLHIEYDLGGANSGAKKITIERSAVFAAIKKDLNKIQELWQQA